MVFASTSFIFLFLPLFLLAYALVGARWRNLTILTFSWIFYAWWRLDFLALIVSIAAWSWGTGLWINRREGKTRRYALLVAISWPLMSLLWFKYANLLAQTATWLGAPLGQWEAVILPIGLSFFVFGAISYSVDVYRKTVNVEHSFINYATYQSMFVHLVAGPVVRYKWVAERLQARAFDRKEFMLGVERFMQGFVLKILIADTLAPLVDSGYLLSAPSATDAILTILAYTLQLYFDFSAYSSMAIGLGLMVGLKFPENFNHPYLSTSLSEFWRRWHISLSSWLRDYLYIPLGGNRQGLARGCINLLITMALGGLWHGASWTFMVWGIWHGSGLIIEKLWRTANMPALPSWSSHIALILFVMLGWMLFRAQTWDEVAVMLDALQGHHGWQMTESFAAILRPNQIICLVLGIALVYLPKVYTINTRVQHLHSAISRVALCPLWLLAIWVLQGRTIVPFLYFQF